MTERTPRRIVEELDRYIVGQDAAKRAVAIAIRNRWRRQQMTSDIRRDVLPKNILLMGPTGVGKTEIARRLAEMSQAPFLKVEASKYTEVGYHGRDVESMIRDLVEISIKRVTDEMQDTALRASEGAAEEKLLELILRDEPLPFDLPDPNEITDDGLESDIEETPRTERRHDLREMLKNGELENRLVEVEVEQKSPSTVEIFSNAGVEQMGFDFQSLFDRLAPAQVSTRHLPVKEARSILVDQESERRIDRNAAVKEAIDRVQDTGILFIDEIDKVAFPSSGSGPDVSREGVQRDLLPLVEGATVTTRFGPVKTDHILFIAAGAFHMTSPSDLIPELQGRFPIRVRLQSLTQEDFASILVRPKNAITRQYTALLETERVTLEFEDDAIRSLAEIAAEINRDSVDIGARRLHTVMEKLLEDILFYASDRSGDTIVIDRKFVESKTRALIDDDFHRSGH